MWAKPRRNTRMSAKPTDEPPGRPRRYTYIDAKLTEAISRSRREQHEQQHHGDLRSPLLNEEQEPLDWLTFFSTGIKSLAWPTAAIIVLFVLKGELRGFVHTIANRLWSFKGFGVETTFAEVVDQVEELLPAPEGKEITASLSATLGPLEAEANAQRIENISLSGLPPPYIVSQAWLRLEQAIREAVDNIIPTATEHRKRPLNPIAYVNLASLHGILSNDELPAVQKLRDLRNQAVHTVDPSISITDALRYHDIANSLVEIIKQRSRVAKPYLDQADTPTTLRR